MSTQFNNQFRIDTRNFVRQNFLTAVRYPGQVAGLTSFDLNHHLINHHHVVTLDRFTQDPPLMGFWVPQGGSCVIPSDPGATSFVFTPDFSGCSILVDQTNEGQYRAYHVQGGAQYLQQEYLGDANGHGLGLAGSMTFDDYGDAALPRGFAFLKYEQGRWWIYYQRQNGVGLGYNHEHFYAVGPQTVRGGARVPVADLRFEVPRLSARHSGSHLPITRNVRTQVRMLPNDELW
jgi:hypothetical protein